MTIYAKFIDSPYLPNGEDMIPIKGPSSRLFFYQYNLNECPVYVGNVSIDGARHIEHVFNLVGRSAKNPNIYFYEHFEARPR